jgi:predicted phosphodiesterase
LKKHLLQIFFILNLYLIHLFAQNDQEIKIGFVSDTQQPLWIEKLFLNDYNNETATNAIFNSLIYKEDIVSLFHLGDLTSFGTLDSEWKIIDSHLKLLKKKQIPVYPAFGNHDYYFISGIAQRQFKKRFPWIKESWYSVRIKNVGVVILNSNYSNLTDSEIRVQKHWYAKKIKELENDNSIQVIIVGTHHSPYTNSKVVDPSEDVQKDFVPLFLKSKKSKLFISGHSHAFEHFKKSGKDFLVIGGGGGLQHPLLTGNEQLFKDLFVIPTSKRMFHYLVLTNSRNHIYATVKMLNKDFKTFQSVYQIHLSH